MKKLILALLAFSSITLPKTLVYFLNKTSATVSMQYGATPGPESSAYGWGPVQVAPNQEVQIAWLNRDQGIKSGKDYQFNQYIVLPSAKVRLSQWLHGKFGGSNILMSGMLMETQKDFPGRYSSGHFTLTFTSGGKSYSLYGEYLPLKAGDTNENIKYILTETGVDTSANKLKLIQYNIQQRPSSEGLGAEAAGFFGVKALGKRGDLSTTALPAALNQFNPDVVTVNEAFTAALRPTLEANMKKIGLIYQTPVLNQSVKTAGWSGGVMIFSRFPITKIKEYVYTSKAGLDKNAAKGVLYAQINKKGKLYNIFATHTNASYAFKGKTRLPMDDEGRIARAGQFKELAQFIKNQNIPSNQPVIIVGDMNVDMISEKGDLNPGSASTKEGSEYTNMIKTLNATLPSLTGYQYTLDVNSNSLVNPDDGPPQYLDYVLYSNLHQKPIKASNAAMCLKSDGRSTCNKAVEDLSDHYPVIAEFEFSATPAAAGG